MMVLRNTNTITVNYKVIIYLNSIWHYPILATFSTSSNHICKTLKTVIFKLILFRRPVSLVNKGFQGIFFRSAYLHDAFNQNLSLKKSWPKLRTSHTPSKPLCFKKLFQIGTVKLHINSATIKPCGLYKPYCHQMR